MQQLNIARIRAVESSKWVVSVSTTGVSAIIDNQGHIRQITRQNEPSYVSKDVELHSEESLANRLGQWTSIIGISLSLLVYFGKRRRNV
jgi:apolipoprotein N-acyltransferase